MPWPRHGEGQAFTDNRQRESARHAKGWPPVADPLPQTSGSPDGTGRSGGDWRVAITVLKSALRIGTFLFLLH